MDLEKMGNNRCINKKEVPQYYYMKIRFASVRKLNLDEIALKSMFLQGLKELYGDVGASLLIDILHYQQEDSEVILRVEDKGLTQIWSSLSWFQTFNGNKVNFRIEKVSCNLISLSVNSRNFIPCN